MVCIAQPWKLLDQCIQANLQQLCQAAWFETASCSPWDHVTGIHALCQWRENNKGARAGGVRCTTAAILLLASSQRCEDAKHMKAVIIRWRYAM